MKRAEKIEHIGNKIQSLINKLKDMDCSIDGYIGGIGVVDYKLSNDNINDNSDIVFTFDTSSR